MTKVLYINTSDSRGGAARAKAVRAIMQIISHTRLGSFKIQK